MLTLVSNEIEEYATHKSEPTSQLLRDLVQITNRETELPIMLTGALEGRFLKLITQIISARRVLEIGMFTGYSALSMAEGLPVDGELITLELEQKYIDIAKAFFEKSEHGHKIKIKKGPALESLKTMEGPFDLVFIDADKTNYINYYEAALPLVRTGGVILIDNVLYSGEVLAPESENSKVIAELNNLLSHDERVDRVLLPIRDGVFFVRKR